MICSNLVAITNMGKHHNLWTTYPDYCSYMHSSNLPYPPPLNLPHLSSQPLRLRCYCSLNLSHRPPHPARYNNTLIPSSNLLDVTSVPESRHPRRHRLHLHNTHSASIFHRTMAILPRTLPSNPLDSQKSLHLHKLENWRSRANRRYKTRSRKISH